MRKNDERNKELAEGKKREWKKTKWMPKDENRKRVGGRKILADKDFHIHLKSWIKCLSMAEIKLVGKFAQFLQFSQFSQFSQLRIQFELFWLKNGNPF